MLLHSTQPRTAAPERPIHHVSPEVAANAARYTQSVDLGTYGIDRLAVLAYEQQLQDLERQRATQVGQQAIGQAAFEAAQRMAAAANILTPAAIEQTMYTEAA